MSRHDPLVRVLHMRDHACEAVEMIRDAHRSDLDSNRMLCLALTRLLEVVGEAARRVPPEFRAQYPDIPWRNISDLRNRLIHGYDKVDLDRLWNISQDELLPLIEQLENIIAEHQ